MAADIQIDEHSQQEARTVIQALAELTGIPAYEVHIQETHNDDGSTDIHIETHEINMGNHKKPNLTLISNDNMDKDN